MCGVRDSILAHRQVRAFFIDHAHALDPCYKLFGDNYLPVIGNGILHYRRYASKIKIHCPLSQ